MNSLLESVAACHGRSALIFRAHGKGRAGWRAEQAASRIRLILEHPRSVDRMRVLAHALDGCAHTRTLLETALEGAIALMGADLGNIQIRDPADGALTIAATSGFAREFVEYLARVDDDSSSCGRSASAAAQTVIVDVTTDIGFAPHRAMAAASGFRAVQSTPLIDLAGRVRGVVSTYYRDPHRPSQCELQIIAWYGERVAAAIGDHQRRPAALYRSNATLHEQSAECHETTAAHISQCADRWLNSGDRTHAIEAQDWARQALYRARRERACAEALSTRALDTHENPHPSRAASAA